MGVNGEWRLARFIVKSRDAHGNAVDVLYVARDITEEKSRELMYQIQETFGTFLSLQDQQMPLEAVP